MRWPSTRVPISIADVIEFGERFKPHLTEDFDTSVFALLLKGREDFTLSEPLYTESGNTAKMLVTVMAMCGCPVCVKQEVCGRYGCSPSAVRAVWDRVLLQRQ
ncbi:MAG: hypothetical protein U0694_06205 [Anaerolineae bacterium]